MRGRRNKITVRLSDRELRRLKAKVKKTGLSQEAYVRTLIEGYEPKALPPDIYHDMMRELSAITGTISEIVARAQREGFFRADEYEFRADELRSLMLDIQAAVTLPEKR